MGSGIGGDQASPLNVVDGVRINTGMAYLTAAVRARPNLAIRGDAEVHGVVIEG
jgi:choline dehydrogenase